MNTAPIVTQVGGFVRSDALYIRRAADDELLDALRSARLAHVLAPRQSGKSSLKQRTIATLRGEGWSCAAIDLNEIGNTGVNIDQWFYSFAELLVEKLKLPIDLDAFWTMHEKRSVAARWSEFVAQWLVPREEEKPRVIFVDEIDVILALPDVADEFFGSIRAPSIQAADERVSWSEN